jgi:hypothetical protein
MCKVKAPHGAALSLFQNTIATITRKETHKPRRYDIHAGRNISAKSTPPPPSPWVYEDAEKEFGCPIHVTLLVIYIEERKKIEYRGIMIGCLLARKMLKVKRGKIITQIGK